MKYQLKVTIKYLILCGFISFGWSVGAQNLSALSRVDTESSVIEDRLFGGVSINLELTQALPFRIFTMVNPNRVIIDFNTLEWSTLDARSINSSEIVNDIRFGIYKPGWTRLILPIQDFLNVESAEMMLNSTKTAATLKVFLDRTDEATFVAQSGPPELDAYDEVQIQTTFEPRRRQIGDRPLVIALDPGHGGVDPGAISQKYLEKNVVLGFARELKAALIKTGRYKAELTRNDDEFISLTGRISRAHAIGADVLISLHADALAGGTASGVTVYTLSERASTTAAAQLAAQLDAADIISGVDLKESDANLTSVLMDMARIETNARSEALAEEVVDGIADSIQKSRRRPRLSAAFTVLKAPDIPSILIELGFLTTERDLKNLLNDKWRAAVVRGIVNSLDKWAVSDAADAMLLRK